MKKIMLFLTGIFMIKSNYAQLSANLIPNPSFENGTISSWIGHPTDWDTKVPNWKRGCSSVSGGGSPDIFQEGWNCASYGIPINKWAINLPISSSSPSGSKRYAGMSKGEPILGETGGVLSAGVYVVAFEASKSPGVNQNCSGTLSTPFNSTSQIVVSLRKSSNLCSAEQIVYTAPSILTGSWQNFSYQFTLTSSQAAMGYDRIEFRSTEQAVFIDNVSLKKKTPIAHFQFTNPGQTVINEDSYYGPLPVTQICQTLPTTCVTINGSASENENGYYIEVAEFNSAAWTSSTPMYSQWVSGTGEVPASDINLCNLSGVAFQPGKLYMVSLAVGSEWNTETHWIRINPTPTISAVPDQTICAGTSASIPVSTNNWPIKVYKGKTLMGTYYSSPIILSPIVTTTYKFLTTNSFGCSASDMATITVSNCPMASFVFTNPGQTVGYENSKYGPIQVTTMCADRPSYCVTIDGSASSNEDRYYISITEFDLNSWTDIVNNTAPNVSPLWNNWVCVGCTVPASKNLCDLTSLTPGANFQPGKLYKVKLAVGPLWHSTEKFIRITDCATQARKMEIAAVENSEAVYNSINIYPNPTNGKFNIEFEENSVQQITVTDALGKIVLETKTAANSTNTSLDLTNYPSGVYFIKINAGEKIIMKRIVKD